MTNSSMNDFNIEKILGKGSFGSVYLVRRKEDHKIYALKSVYIEKLNKKEQQNSVNEVRILASVNHPNVIGYKEAFWDEKDNTLNIVMEYADDGDLQTKINKMKKERLRFEENMIWSYSIQMIEGLKALHDKKIMHRDLKSANIFLVKDKNQCKIGDMNVSKVIKEKELLTQTGTPYYASPEVWRDEPYSYKSDLWSIGCVIYELCNLRPPFKGKDLDELFMNVCKGKPERIYNTYSDDLWKMILMLLQVDVKNRCDCNKFLNSPLITRKIKELKNENNEYKNLEKNKEINEGDLLNTIRFDNILDIKGQLPTKKNYANENTSQTKSNKENSNETKKMERKKNIMKYQKINNRTKLNKIPIKKDIKKENDVNKINLVLKKQIKNSPKIKREEKENSMVYQKPKLLENSVKREKKMILLNEKPMTTKRPVKNFNYMEKIITPKRDRFDKNEINKIYVKGYTLVDRDKKFKNIQKPIITSPCIREKEIYNNIIKKKNYSKKILSDKRSYTTLGNNTNNYLLGINRAEIDLNVEDDLKKGINNKLSNKIRFSNNKENNVIKTDKIIPLREKKVIDNKDEKRREMTDPNLLINRKKLNEKGNTNLSLKDLSKKEKIQRIIKYNRHIINKKENQNNPLICNNYVTINNTLVSNYPVKLAEIFN